MGAGVTQTSLFPSPPAAPSPGARGGDPCLGCRSLQDGRYCGALVGPDTTRAQQAAAWIMAGMGAPCGARIEKTHRGLAA